MSQKLFAVVTGANGDGPAREIELPGTEESQAWPISVGSAEGNAIQLEDDAVPSRAAEIHGSANHFYVVALAGAQVEAHGIAVAPGSSARFEELRIGPYRLRLEWRG